MKLKSIILPALAVCCLAISVIGSANAYFTTYVTAKGGTHINFYHREEIHEEFRDWKKYVTISCDEKTTIPMVVRVRAFSGDDVSINIPESNDWHKDGDWYYYKGYLLGGNSGKDKTSQLVVAIDKQRVDDLNKDEDNFNVIVVYESIPAAFDDDDNLIDPWTLGDKWNGALKKEVKP